MHHFTDTETFRRYASLAQLQGSHKGDDFKVVFHRYLGYIPKPNYVEGKNRHNSLGFRGEEFPLAKPAGEYRIICIGESTTYTSFVEDYRQSYPDLLQKQLHEMAYNNVRVLNAGVGGWRSYESLINLQFRLLALDPDLIVISQSVSDVMSRFVWPPEKYLGDNSGHLQPRFSRVFMSGVLEHSTLFRILMIRANLTSPHAALERLSNRYNKETYFGKEFVRQKRKGIYPQGIFETVPAMEMLRQNKPIYYKNNIDSMVAIAKNNDIDVLLANLAYLPVFENAPKSSSEEFVEAYGEQNQIMESIAIKQGVYFLDAMATFPQDESLYVDGHHVNEKGAQVKAEIFAGFIADNILSLLK